MNNVYTKEANCINYSHDAMNATQRAIKRAFDFISAFLGLIILSPLFLIIYIMLKRQKTDRQYSRKNE